MAFKSGNNFRLGGEDTAQFDLCPHRHRSAEAAERCDWFARTGGTHRVIEVDRDGRLVGTLADLGHGRSAR